MSESVDTVTVIFTVEQGSTATLSFPKPVVQVRTKPRRHIIGYTCSNIYTNGWKLIQFNPAFLYLSTKNTHNFKLLAAKVCIEGDNMIVSNRSM